MALGLKGKSSSRNLWLSDDIKSLEKEKVVYIITYQLGSFDFVFEIIVHVLL